LLNVHIRGATVLGGNMVELRLQFGTEVYFHSPSLETRKAGVKLCDLRPTSSSSTKEAGADRHR
jgi:hypothetical protein